MLLINIVHCLCQNTSPASLAVCNPSGPQAHAASVRYGQRLHVTSLPAWGGRRGPWQVMNQQGSANSLDSVDMHGQFSLMINYTHFCRRINLLFRSTFLISAVKQISTKSQLRRNEVQFNVGMTTVKIHTLKGNRLQIEGCVCVCVCVNTCMHIHEHKHKSCTIMICLIKVTICPFFHGCHLLQKAY